MRKAKEDVMVYDIEEVVTNLIYHGRHFNPDRDGIVIHKSVDRLVEIMNNFKSFKEQGGK